MNPQSTTRQPRASDAVSRRLTEYVIARTGLAYYRDKNDELHRHLHTRLRELGLNDVEAYLHFLTSDAGGEAEFDRLVEELTIGETYFFRHASVFDALRERILPELLHQNRDRRRLRIWSAGCSFGAEPYSLSIVLRKQLAHLTAGWAIQIVGTDVNRRFLARAREGSFEDWAFRGVGDEVKRDCFSRGPSGWRIAPRFQQDVTFEHHNLVTDAIPSAAAGLYDFDLILCRNVMIYFSSATADQAVSGFFNCLVEGGLLIVGHAESNVERFRSFRTINEAHAVYYRRSSNEPDVGAPARVDGAAAQSPGLGALQTLPFVEPSVIHHDRPERPSSRQTFSSGVEPAETFDADSAKALLHVRELADRGEMENAVNRCARLVETDKLNPSVHLYHGLLLDQTGNVEGAERSLRRAVYLNRHCPLSHYYLGMNQKRRGLIAEAVRSLNNALDLLSRMDDSTIITHGDDVTIGDLRRMAMAHLEGIKIQ
ncbi:MAG: protein-glutamate O-methyltransferase CheR [Phycisphaeraceae bacterium]